MTDPQAAHDADKLIAQLTPARQALMRSMLDNGLITPEFLQQLLREDVRARAVLAGGKA